MSQRRRVTRYLLEAAAVLSLAVLASAVLGLHLTRPPIGYQQALLPDVSTTVRARVERIEAETETQTEDGFVTVSQRLVLQVLSAGPYKGEIFEVEYNGMGPTLSAVRFRQGSQALVMISQLNQNPAGDETEANEAPEIVVQVADHVRLLPLALIGALFAAVTVSVGRWQGLRALLGLAVSWLFIGGFILPQILANRDPVLVTMVGSALLLAATLYLLQGWNAVGHTALLGVLVSLAITGAIAILAAEVAYLTGFGSEETLYLQATGVTIQMRGLLLAGIILGAAGVLDDVIIAQTVTVFELSKTDPDLRSAELRRRGMRVGVSHLTSMVNTLIIAYASTALPLFILFYLYPEPWYLTINRELIAEEILRALVGSIGLLLAVPMTTLIAAWVAPQFSSTPATQGASGSAGHGPEG
ncbi:MAG: YibE/F family protein [Anaerolineae bacterium]|nr:YibE/F family protein [Anaerolineae bacterium]